MNFVVFCVEKQPNYGCCPKPYKSYFATEWLYIALLVFDVLHSAFGGSLLFCYASKVIGAVSTRDRKHDEITFCLGKQLTYIWIAVSKQLIGWLCSLSLLFKRNDIKNLKAVQRKTTEDHSSIAHQLCFRLLGTNKRLVAEISCN